MGLLSSLFDPTVVISGSHTPQWNEALCPASTVWSRVRGVHRVIVDPAASGDFLTGKTNAKRFIVIPLLEKHAKLCPRQCRTAIPSSTAIEFFENKLRFAQYARRHGLLDYTPVVFDRECEVIYPCVIKRTDLNGSVGVRVIQSSEQLRVVEHEEPWRGEQYILQEYVAAPLEYTAHLFVKNGSVLWNAVYSYQSTQLSVRRVGFPFTRARLGAQEIEIIEQFLKPVSYTGPCNVDYILREDGRMAILEINPRLGGSLMRTDNVSDLTMMVQHIVDHAAVRPNPYFS